MTTVRIAVASVDGIPSIPILARIAVSAAAAADTNAYTIHPIASPHSYRGAVENPCDFRGFFRPLQALQPFQPSAVRDSPLIGHCAADHRADDVDVLDL